MKWVVRLETSVCFRITRLMNNQIKSLGCVSQASDALVSQGRESRRNPMQKVLEPIQRVRFTVYASSCEHPRKERTIVGKNNVKVPYQRSPYAMKFEDSSHERQQRCAGSKAWNLAKNIFKHKEKDNAAFYFPAAGCVNKKSPRKESLW